jgi:hypothetical protein
VTSADIPEWVNLADVQRSRLDPDVWWPWYGSDKSCFAFPGRLRRVKTHVENVLREPVMERRARWRRVNPDYWVYEIPYEIAEAILGEGVAEGGA